MPRTGSLSGLFRWGLLDCCFVGRMGEGLRRIPLCLGCSVVEVGMGSDGVLGFHFVSFCELVFSFLR